MTALQKNIKKQERYHLSLAKPSPLKPSAGNSAEAGTLDKRFEELHFLSPSSLGFNRSGSSVAEQLYDALAQFKIFTSQIAMHLEDGWRARLFKQLDELLDIEEWDKRDKAPSLESFATFLRLMLILRPDVRPGLGASAGGHLIAAWTNGDDRLTIEALSADEVRWSVAVWIDEERERAAGFSTLQRLHAVLEPYGPGRWFAREAQIARKDEVGG